MPQPDIFFDLERNDFSVGGNIPMDTISAFFVRGFQVLIVVDIAIEADMNLSADVIRSLAGMVVNRVTVCFGNRTDRCPASMG